MTIEETFTVKANLETLWHCFLDPEFLGPCIPGCEEVETVSPTEYNSIVKAKVGVFSVGFKVRTLVEKVVQFESIETAGEGKELRKLGQFRQRTTVKFAALSEGETEVSYRSEVSMVGKLATFGDKIMRTVAKDMGTAFATAVQAKFASIEPQVA